jgi:signal transduction protein with GAF and PtsI domain
MSGYDAKQILESQVFKSALDSVDKTIMNSIKATPIDGKPETRAYLDKLYCCLKVSDMIKQQLKAAMVNGAVEEAAFQRKRFRGKGTL